LLINRGGNYIFYALNPTS